MDLEFILQECLGIAREAGQLIMAVAKRGKLSEKNISYKYPDHPVTKADKVSHEHILARLSVLTPSVPIISEESDSHLLPDFNDYFWLVDPLDGTKEFIKGSSEFTVNIALIQKSIPILGVIYVPASQFSYFGGRDVSSGVIHEKDAGVYPLPSISSNLPPPYILSLSRSHKSSKEDLLLSALSEEVEFIPDYCGSSLKFARVAEGKSHFYARFGPTMEWDTAAGQAIVMYSGGKVVDWNWNGLVYGKPGFRNPGLIAVNECGFDLEVIWKKIGNRIHRN